MSGEATKGKVSPAYTVFPKRGGGLFEGGVNLLGVPLHGTPMLLSPLLCLELMVNRLAFLLCIFQQNIFVEIVALRHLNSKV